MTSWEYLVEEFSITDRWNPKKQTTEISHYTERLNDLGAQGWEFIKYEAVPLASALTGSVREYTYLLVMKRPRREPSAEAEAYLRNVGETGRTGGAVNRVPSEQMSFAPVNPMAQRP